LFPLFFPVLSCRHIVGLYFLTTLLELHSQVLQTMNAAQLYEWFESIETNQEEWFKRCSFITSGEEYKCDSLKWNEFTAGWIESTASKFYSILITLYHKLFYSFCNRFS
jgi:hypothetical protein